MENGISRPAATSPAADVRRRDLLAALAALILLPGRVRAASRTPLRLAASWQGEGGYGAGVLELAPAAGSFRVAAALDLPTRAHALIRLADGDLLVVARRPGDWLLRLDPGGRARAWRWIEPQRAFCGHALASPDGRRLYTTELDLESGQGLVAMREASTLEKLAEWPSGGMDPHQLLWDQLAPRSGEAPEGCLMVANGGIASAPETGRSKQDLARMDSSLVRLDARHGHLMGQWRLVDRRLSLRHLAWSGVGRPCLGISLQAEHDTPADRAAAPVLATFDGEGLRAHAPGCALAGYGGDIAALDGGYVIGCPRAGGLAFHDRDGAWRGYAPLAEACALAAAGGTVWAAGRAHALGLGLARGQLPGLPGLRLDNHWVILDG